MKNNKTIPKIGLRNIKTGIAVFFCMISYSLARFVADKLISCGVHVPDGFMVLISDNTAIYACLAAVVVMGSSLSKSFRSGLSRIIGTVIGGIFGAIYLHSGDFLNTENLGFILIPTGVIVVIYFLILINENDAIVIALATYLIVAITLDNDAPILYVLNRALSTAYGVIVSLCVNNFISKPKNEEKSEDE